MLYLLYLMRSSFVCACVCVALFVLAGCAGKPIRSFSGNAAQVAAPPDKVSALLAESADRAATALENLAAVEATRTPVADQLAPITQAPAPLMRAITVQWVGPVEPITQALASRAGYTFKVTGRAPPTPIVVTVDAENIPVIEVLRSIGLQMGTRATLRVDEAHARVEIAYDPAEEQKR